MAEVIPLLSLLLALIVTPARAASDLTPFAYDQQPGAHVPLDTALQDQFGRATTIGTAIGHRPTILALGYFHCPNLCGLVRDDLLHALSNLPAPPDYRLVVLSIDPSETPNDALQAWQTDSAQAKALSSSQWRYLTGPQTAINAVTRTVGFRSRFDQSAKQFLHPAGLVFLSGDGTVSSYLLGLGYKPADVQLGLTRAANGVTARALPILLLCFHYDPSTGRYSLAIMRVLQLAAVVTVLVVGGTIMLAMRRERDTS